jgi:hypothetical protein
MPDEEIKNAMEGKGSSSSSSSSSSSRPDEHEK